MADLKISQLPVASTPLAGTELVPIVQGGVTDQTTVGAILTGTVPAGTGNGVAYLNASKVLSTGSNLTFDGTTLTANALHLTTQLGTSYGGTGLTSYTANGVVYASGTGTLATGSALTFDGTNLGVANVASTGALSLGSASTSYAINFNLGAAQLARLAGNAYGIFTVGTEGSVGAIGTNYATLGAYGSAGGGLRIYRGTGAGTPSAIFYSDSTGATLGTAESTPLILQVNGAEKMRLDSSGNLGLGVTPSAWSTFTSVIQSPSYAITSVIGGSDTRIFNNIYFDGSYRYKNNTYAGSSFQQSNGAFYWNSYSGNLGAGNIPSTTSSPMTLHASGGLSLGNTTDPGAGNLSVTGAISGTKNSAAQAVFSGWNSVGGAVAANGQVQVGSTTTECLVLGYDDAGNTTCYIDSTYNSNSSAIKIRTKTAGTPFTALTILGDGSITAGNGLAVTGTLSATDNISSTWSTASKSLTLTSTATGSEGYIKLSPGDSGFGGAVLELNNTASGVTQRGFIYARNGFIYNSNQTSGGFRWGLNGGNQYLEVDNNKSLALQGATAQSGTGITFPATQSASSDANTLDDYEEGTWTPSVGGTATYGADTGGYYIKIGKQVTIWGKIQVSTLGTGSTTTISGLPFASANDVLEHLGSCGYCAVLAVTVGTLIPYVVYNASTLKFYSWSGTGTGSQATDSPAIFGNSTRVYFSTTYQVA